MSFWRKYTELYKFQKCEYLECQRSHPFERGHCPSDRSRLLPCRKVRQRELHQQKSKLRTRGTLRTVQPMAPVIEWTVSKATILGTAGSTFSSNWRKWIGSLWRKMCRGTPLLRIPWIIEAWFPASEKIWQPSQYTVKTSPYLKKNRIERYLTRESFS